jgi:hypothetical protein
MLRKLTGSSTFRSTVIEARVREKLVQVPNRSSSVLTAEEQEFLTEISSSGQFTLPATLDLYRGVERLRK